ncbi:hypothetical protein P886_2001 [Alteromonadaceae bacterium 2753L.S.0a.02]|nr:hypothetical protein P886_2001 [Alteromonadaceae bacterium 2753L.S.0a.02]
MKDLETAILNWFKENNPELENVISRLSIRRREETESGSFTYFIGGRLEDPMENISIYNVAGPYISSPELQGGAMTVLGISDGEIVFLEIMALDDNGNSNSIEKFELKERF